MLRQRGADEAYGRMYANLFVYLIRQAADDLDRPSWEALRRMVEQEFERGERLRRG